MLDEITAGFVQIIDNINFLVNCI